MAIQFENYMCFALFFFKITISGTLCFLTFKLSVTSVRLGNVDLHIYVSIM